MSSPWYVITGEINVNNFPKLLQTSERGFIWRGFTLDCEMKPSAAKYERNEECQPLAEIKRVAKEIYELNKLQKFPFEIPLFVRRVLFPRFYQPEDKLLKELCIKEFPDGSLAQAMSLVQHEIRGTSLLDFSMDKMKALYFAIGKGDNFSQNSHIFGLGVSDFETHKNSFDKGRKKFDILYPSYFMNKKIAHQEGVFLYQKFEINESGCIKGDRKYENIKTFFEARYEEDKKNGVRLYEEKSIDDFLKMTESEGDKPIFYVLLDVPAKEKPALKEYLNTIRITDDFMMAQKASTAYKEIVVSNINDLFRVIDEYSDKGYYFRGEIKDYGKTACLPAYLRDPMKNSSCNVTDSEVLEKTLEELGVGFPRPCDGDTCDDNSIINNFFQNTYPRAYSKWGEDKLQALLTHYSPDFKALAKVTKEKAHGYYESRLPSSIYLDITSDIMVALHFACSEYRFLTGCEEQKNNEVKDGFLFVFDLKEIDKMEFLKLVSYPSYSYFCKEKTGTGDKWYFQSFDRITHQRGAFLALKANENNEILPDNLREEIKSCLHTKITIKSDFKKELYNIFGAEKGLEYYFPKIPCTFSENGNEIQQAYNNLKGVTSCF